MREAVMTCKEAGRRTAVARPKGTGAGGTASEAREEKKSNKKHIMEIKKSTAMAAYNVADENGKKMLRALFPEMEWEEVCEGPKNDDRPVTERIKTFEDACRELGDDHPLVHHYNFNFGGEGSWIENIYTRDLEAYLKLRIIAAALNEGWEPQFTQYENRCYPWHSLWTEDELTGKSYEWKNDHCLRSMEHHRGEWAGLAFAYSNFDPSNSNANVGSRLCFKSCKLAEYAGKQFIDLWMDFLLIRK